MNLIGPIDPVLDMDVVDYLSNSPTPDEYKCLQDFLRQLRREKVANQHWRLHDKEIVVACNHLLKFDFGKEILLDIKKKGGRWQKTYQ